MTLQQEIYLQLLELYTKDLESENFGLHLQVKAYEVIKTHQPPAPVYQPGYHPNWPHQYPIWCITETKTVRTE